MYRGRIERDLKIWVSKGFIEPAAAERMLAEYDARDTVFSVGRVFTLLAALLLSAAILLLVAANWEAIPRLARVFGIIGLIWTFYLSAAFCFARSFNGLGAALLVMGTLTFGGAIALVGQMYNLSGDAVDALLVWLAAACLACIAFRSAALAVVSGFLAWWVFGQLVFDNEATLEGNGLIYAVPFIALLILGLVRYTNAGPGRHLAYLLALAWLGWFYIELPELWVAALLFVAGFVVFLATVVPWSPFFRIAQDAGAAPSFYAFALAVVGLIALQVEVISLAEDVAVSILTLAVALAGIALAGRLNGAVRYLGYLVFAAQILYLAFETLGTILGTSGFFLVSGIVVAVIAWVIVRLEKRLAARHTVVEV